MPRKKKALEPEPYWRERVSLPRFPPLEHDLEVDVDVVGAGITGVTAAYLLSAGGRSVALLERDRLAGIDRLSAICVQPAMPLESSPSGITVFTVTKLDRSDSSSRHQPKGQHSITSA